MHATWIAAARTLVASLALIATVGSHAQPMSTSTSHQGHDAAMRCEQRSDALLHALRRGDYSAARAGFDARVAGKLDNASLARLWSQQLPGAVGTFTSAGKPSATEASGHTVVDTPLHFAKKDLRLHVACDANGTIGGLFFLPALRTETPVPASALSDGIREQTMAVPSPFGPLPGALMLPAGRGPFPAVLLVGGSGPTDRDGTLGPNKPQRDIALALAHAGIASLRYDKRSRVYPDQMIGTAVTVDDDVTDDAERALQLLVHTPNIDASRLFLAGHSLGGLMAPRIARRGPPLAGVILLAAPVQAGLDLMLQQARYLQKIHPRPAIKTQIAQIEQARDRLARANPEHPPAGLFFHAPASYWLSLRSYDAIATAKALREPILILQGDDDYQVPPAGNLSRWRSALGGNARVTIHDYPGLSHLFMPGGKPPSPADYRTPSHVSRRMTDDMVHWIRAQPAVGSRTHTSTDTSPSAHT